MDELQYQAWWQLHLKHCRRESLSAAEQSIYEAGKAQLTAEECVPGDSTALKQQREVLAMLERENERLRRKRHLLAREIRSLEAQIVERGKEKVGMRG